MGKESKLSIDEFLENLESEKENRRRKTLRVMTEPKVASPQELRLTDKMLRRHIIKAKEMGRSYGSLMLARNPLGNRAQVDTLTKKFTTIKETVAGISNDQGCEIVSGMMQATNFFERDDLLLRKGDTKLIDWKPEIKTAYRSAPDLHLTDALWAMTFMFMTLANYDVGKGIQFYGFVRDFFNLKDEVKNEYLTEAFVAWIKHEHQPPVTL